jgi:galactosylceramidase
MAGVILMARIISALVVLVAATSIEAAEAPHQIRLDPATSGRVFQGVGAVSAGASSRLLVDYPEPQRSQILDFLFKPKFGASFQHLKVEIGGGENSTCGSEPSHAITRAELANPKPRGYEFWLMAEARKRNPQIALDCLPWTFPAWVEDPFSEASAEYFAAFLETAQEHYDLELDWVAAAQNEMGTDPAWIRDTLHPTLEAHGFTDVKLQAPDNSRHHWEFFDVLENDPELDRLIEAVGYHYVDGRRPWKIDQQAGRGATVQAKKSGKPLWASEEWSQSGREWGGKGAMYLARLINKVYIRDRITNYQIWCPIDSIYDQIIWPHTGAMQADSPWSGHYNVWPAIWAIAHTTQFAQPGWRYLNSACGQIDADTWRGSHVALRHPKTDDWSAIVVTGDARTVRLEVAPALERGPVHVWKSTADEQFVELEPRPVRDGTVEIDLGANAIYTLTTTTGQRKGSHGQPPAQHAFPLPFEDDFEAYQPIDTPRYFADQKGTFEVVERAGEGMCLAQVVPAQGILWHGHSLLKPHTLFGSPQWQDVAIEADVRLGGGEVEIGGRYAHRTKLGYRWILDRDGRWQLNWQKTTLAKGQLAKFDPDAWHQLRLELDGKRITGFIDGQRVTEVTDTSRASGMAFLASSYDRNCFDNVRVQPLTSDTRSHR